MSFCCCLSCIFSSILLTIFLFILLTLYIRLRLTVRYLSLRAFEFRLTVGSDFDSKYWNRLDPSISTLEIDLKSESISNILNTNRHNSTRFSISILEIESNCQEIKNYVILLRISILNFKF